MEIDIHILDIQRVPKQEGSLPAGIQVEEHSAAGCDTANHFCWTIFCDRAHTAVAEDRAVTAEGLLQIKQSEWNGYLELSRASWTFPVQLPLQKKLPWEEPLTLRTPLVFLDMLI